MRSALSLLSALALAAPALAGPIDFNRDVRPILTGKCFQCHGPDDKARKAGLRLDLRDAALGKLRSGARAVIPGQPAQSERLRRIDADIDEIMPPARTGKPLSADERTTLRRWIEQGAPF